MKTSHITNFMIAVCGVGALSTAAHAELTAPANTSTPSIAMRPVPETNFQGAAAPDVTSARWADIKDCSFDQRARFFAGLEQLESRVDRQIGELTARRAAMSSNIDTKNWDFAMKEMADARSYLRSVGDELRKASAETWNQQKDTVGNAWLRTQEAYDKVKSSTTS